jgi:Tfp pilus assembly protein PilV
MVIIEVMIMLVLMVILVPEVLQLIMKDLQFQRELGK